MFLTTIDAALVIFISAAIYLFLPSRWRWLLLLVLSAGFLFAYSRLGLAVAAGQVIGAYVMGLVLEKYPRRYLIWPFVLAQFLPWNYFKIWDQGLLMPVGISFYSFQIISYLVEIYWGRHTAERHFGRLAAFILFFGTKLAGPIERPKMLAQFVDIQTPTPQQLVRSAIWIWVGLFQKFVLADQLVSYILPVFTNPEGYGGLTMTFVVLISKYQIFCDFAGATMIALGLGGLFGLQLTPNFARPFASTSLREYWTRWHISLQTWIRDYVFFPLLSTPFARLGVFPIMVFTFVLFAIWHDFNWTFLVYGVLQAVLIKIEPTRFLKRLGWPVAMLFTYCVLVCLPSVLFRSHDMNQAISVWRNMGWDTGNWKYFIALSNFGLIKIFVFVVLYEVLSWLDARYGIYSQAYRLPWIVKLILAIVLLIVLILNSKLGSDSVFIYSRF